MLFTRIKRGAGRATLLIQHNLFQHRVIARPSLWQATRALFLSGLALRTALMPVPLAAPATAVAAGPDDADPSPRLVRVSVSAHEALQLTETDLSLTVATLALAPVAVGTSTADVKAAEAAAAEAARKEAAAKELAAIKARKLAAVPASTLGTGEVQQIIREAAAKYGVDAELMLRIAKCESGFRPNARNRSGSSASGLFQFMPGTYANSPSGRAGLSIFDARANAEAAAFKIANGALRAWNASKHCWGR